MTPHWCLCTSVWIYKSQLTKCEKLNETRSGQIPNHPLYLKAGLGSTLGHWLASNGLVLWALLGEWCLIQTIWVQSGRTVRRGPSDTDLQIYTGSHCFCDIYTEWSRNKFTCWLTGNWPDLLLIKLTRIWSAQHKQCTAKQAASVRGFLAFGLLGWGLLRFLSSPCSHCRWAGLPFTAPLWCCHRHLAPRPAARGKQGPSVSLFVKCHVQALSKICLR